MIIHHVSASDCFELGRQSYHNRDYYHTVLWMQEAMDRLQEEQNVTTTSKPDILEYLAFSTYMQGSDSKLYCALYHTRGNILKESAFLAANKQIYLCFCFYRRSGNVARALSMTNELLELVPTHERALGNRAYYQKEIQSKASQSKKKRGEDGKDDTAIPEQVKPGLSRDRNQLFRSIRR